MEIRLQHGRHLLGLVQQRHLQPVRPDQGRRRHQRVAHGQLHHLLVEQAGEQRQCDPGLSDPGRRQHDPRPEPDVVHVQRPRLLDDTQHHGDAVRRPLRRRSHGRTQVRHDQRCPNPKVEAVWRSGQTGYRPGCESGDCQYIAYRLSNYQGNIVCTINSSDGAFDTKDDGLNGRYDPHNGDNVSHKFFGFPGGWVTVSCAGANGSDSFTRNPGV